MKKKGEGKRKERKRNMELATKGKVAKLVMTAVERVREKRRKTKIKKKEEKRREKGSRRQKG